MGQVLKAVIYARSFIPCEVIYPYMDDPIPLVPPNIVEDDREYSKGMKRVNRK